MEDMFQPFEDNNLPEIDDQEISLEISKRLKSKQVKMLGQFQLRLT
jgi:hypothetical protein